MTTEFVAGEILRHIREESIDPPIGEEAEGVSQLNTDPLEFERVLSRDTCMKAPLGASCL